MTDKKEAQQQTPEKREPSGKDKKPKARKPKGRRVPKFFENVVVK